MQRNPAKSLKVSHTFKVVSHLSPDTFWVGFCDGENLKEPESNSYGFAMVQTKTTKVISQNWIVRKEPILKSTRIWARRKSTMYRKTESRKKSWFQVRIWSIL
jgi:hypothetical protein